MRGSRVTGALTGRLRGWFELARRALDERNNFVRVAEPIFFRRAPAAGEVDPLAWASQQPSDVYGHLGTLFMLSMEIGAKTVLELGTRSGMSTIALLAAAREMSARVYSIDVDDCVEAHRAIAQMGLREHWQPIRGHDLHVEWSLPVDHLFIDTTHEYEHTRAELARFEPFVAPGGVITLHDSFAFPAVDRAVRDHARGRSDLRVYRHFHNNGLIVMFKGPVRSRPPPG